MAPSLRSLRRLSAAALILLTFTALSAPSVFAQGRGPGIADPAARADRMMSTLTEAVSLTDAQVEQVRPLVLDHVARQQAAFAALRGSNRGAGRAGMREAMAVLRAELDAQIEPLLTPEQVTAFRAHRAARPQRGRGGF